MRILRTIFLSALMLFLASCGGSNSTPASYAPAIQKAKDSVVNLYAIQEDAEDSQNSSVNYRLGSGVIMDSKGHILTNYHVAFRSKLIFVVMPDGRKTEAKLIGSDPDTDLAVVQVPYRDISPVKTGNSDTLEIGDVVLAIGNPFGLGQTVTHGIVSAMGRNTLGINQLENYIQIDAAINPGNSGGALINSQGKLMGITVGIYSRTGGFQGVGFAIPTNIALNVMRQIIEKGHVDRAYIGVNVMTLNMALAKELKISQGTGVVVVHVVPNSPAAQAGFKVNDVILSIEGFRVQNARGFLNYIETTEPGKPLRFKILRDQNKMELEVKTQIRPAQPLLDDRGQPQLPGERKDLPDNTG